MGSIRVLVPLGALAYKENTFRDESSSFQELFKDNESLAPIALRFAVTNVIPEIVESLMEQNVLWDYKLEDYDPEECPCLECSGTAQTAKQLAMRLSYDIWDQRIENLRSKITRIQSVFIPYFSDEDIISFLIRNPNEAYEILLKKGYTPERIISVLGNHRWLINFRNNVKIPITSTLHTENVSKDDLKKFVDEIGDSDIRTEFIFLKDFISNYPAYSRDLFAKAIAARSGLSVRNMIHLGILNFDIGNPFEYLTGYAAMFKREKDDNYLICLLRNYGFQVNIKAIEMLIACQDYVTLVSLIDYFDDTITLDQLEKYRDPFFENIEMSSIIVYKIAMRERVLPLENMSISD